MINAFNKIERAYYNLNKIGLYGGTSQPQGLAVHSECGCARQTLIGGNRHVPPFIFNDVRVITREPSKPGVLGCITVSPCSDECDRGQ